MANKKITWQEKVSATAYDDIYPETDSSQVILNNTINNNLGINIDSRLDTALESITNTNKSLRAEGTSTGNALALELNVPVFELLDGVMARVKIHVNTSANATLNVNNTGAKPIIRIDGEPIDLELKQGTWCIFIYSSSLDSWVFEGWSTKSVVKTVIFTENGTWTVPANVTSADVFVFGGGGQAGSNRDVGDSDNHGYGYGGGGGGGYMNRSNVTLTPGAQIPITIGKAGTSRGGNGGTTSFGALLSAQGGSGGSSGTATSSSGNGGDGGSGGSGGGGGEAYYRVPNPNFNTSGGASHFTYSQPGGKGGAGAQFGGGGGARNAAGGNGGTYGGGGGSYGSTVATGGTYGGNGGSNGGNGAKGTDTRNIKGLEFYGEGKGGTGNGSTYSGSGGGGGYGGNGGSNTGLGSGGGGGGGYGGNGANGSGRGGGGGGYGGNGNGTGGGGYGIGNYGCGGDSYKDALSANSGICIITYMAQEA